MEPPRAAKQIHEALVREIDLLPPVIAAIVAMYAAVCDWYVIIRFYDKKIQAGQQHVISRFTGCVVGDEVRVFGRLGPSADPYKSKFYVENQHIQQIKMGETPPKNIISYKPEDMVYVDGQFYRVRFVWDNNGVHSVPFGLSWSSLSDEKCIEHEVRVVHADLKIPLYPWKEKLPAFIECYGHRRT
jgi:hypothetical protein